MFILHVTYEVKEGKREEFLKKLAELQVAEKTAAEPGNRDYTYYLPADGSNKVFLTEVWENRDSQAAHTRTEHFKALGEIKNEYVNNTILKKFDDADEVE